MAGGLWLLYLSPLYPMSVRYAWLHVVVHAHLFVAGYLFTASVVGVDPTPHRPDLWLRAAVLLLVLAAHAVLAKYLYGHPPPGVPAVQAERGAVLMYYGGDAVSATLIVLLGRQWLRAATDGSTGTAPRARRCPTRRRPRADRDPASGSAR
jgi:putative membrane protein